MSGMSRVTTRFFFGCLFTVLIIGVTPSSADEAIDLSASVDPQRVTRLQYRLSIRGKMITMQDSGPNEMDLTADARFIFRQRQFASEISGPFSVRGFRYFDEAALNTVVAKTQKTEVILPNEYRLCAVWGTDTGIVHVSPEVRFTRQQVDLLQLSCDPLIANDLLPTRHLKDRTEKWNVDTWVIPMLCGLEAAATQSMTCELVELRPDEAVIQFTGNADGAVQGSAANVTLTGTFTFDRRSRLVTALKAEQKEKRTPGTVSPGLDVIATVEWSQQPAEATEQLPAALVEQMPTERQLLLTLPTPWRLNLLHSRQWHLSHRSSDVIMLRLLKNGGLIAQVNIAPAPTVTAGGATPEDKFQEEVKASLRQQKGTVLKYEVLPPRPDWKIQHVRARSEGGAKAIIWDYYLCSWKTGEQFLLIFSHAEMYTVEFTGEAEKILDSMVVPPVRPPIRLPR